MGNKTEHTQAFQCPYCHTLNEHCHKWKGTIRITCTDCERIFFGKIEKQLVFKSFKRLKELRSEDVQN